MADTLTTKKVTELTENTAMSDDDLFMVGSAGTASLRKLKWSNIWNTIKTAILGKLVANNLTTTAAGYLLDARQGKALDDKISKLNTDMFKYKTILIGEITIKAGNAINKDVPLNLPSDAKIVYIYITSNTYFGWFLIGYGSNSTASNLKIGIRNTYTSQLTDTFYCVIGYV